MSVSFEDDSHSYKSKKKVKLREDDEGPIKFHAHQDVEDDIIDVMLDQTFHGKKHETITREYSEEECVQLIGSLVLDLSLVTSLPIACTGRDKIRASAAASSIAYFTNAMGKSELRNFEWTIQPLLDILIVDIDSPLCTKSALALKTLMLSRVCMNRLIACDGLRRIASVLDILLAKRVPELKQNNFIHDTVENLAICYREFARFHPWKIVDVGALRHCVVLLKLGDVVLQTVAASIMASLSDDLNICKQMFSYGAIKPLLNVSNAEITNDACMLAGLGCITQLCRIPEIAQRMVQQGVVPVLEVALHRHVGHSNISIREKALYSLGFLAQNDSLRTLVATDNMLDGIKHEFHSGTIGAKTTILQILMNLHNKYPQEPQMKEEIREEIMVILKTSTWVNKNLCLKVITVLYHELTDREYFVDKGVIKCILNVLTTKDRELQEAPLVCILHLCVHPTIPFKLISAGILKILVKILYAEEIVLRELSVILLKTFLLYDTIAVEEIVPKEKQYLLKRDVYNPQVYGAEYGELIQEYLQLIVENRREQEYLIHMFNEDEKQKYHLTYEELQFYSNLFMEIDAECLGYLGEDEVKMLVVLKGEKLDKEEVIELIREYDTDRSGYLDFKEFVIMMKDWNRRFGTGLTKVYNETIKRGAIGKSIRAFRRWYNKGYLEQAQVDQAKGRRIAERQKARALELKYNVTEQFEEKRRRAMKIREYGLEYANHHGMVLPPIRPNIVNR